LSLANQSFLASSFLISLEVSWLAEDNMTEDKILNLAMLLAPNFYNSSNFCQNVFLIHAQNLLSGYKKLPDNFPPLLRTAVENSLDKFS